MQDADSALKTALPEFLYNITVGPIKNYLCNLSGIKEALENADKDVQLNKEASSAPGLQSRQRLDKIDEDVNGEEDEDGPKTYEIDSSDDD